MAGEIARHTHLRLPSMQWHKSGEPMLHDVVDTASIAPFLDAKHHSLAEKLRAFVHERIAALPRAKDDASARFLARQIAGLLGQNGLMDVLDPLDLRSMCMIREALSWASSLADATYALQCLGAMPLLLSAPGPARERWLAGIVGGEIIPAFAMTEPEAGSDAASMQTTARVVGHDYILDGQKTLISNAGLADVYCVFATINPHAGVRGLCCFAVDAQNPGIRMRSELRLSVPHPIGELELADCRVAASDRLGADGDGLALALNSLDRLRPAVGAAACGAARRALDESLKHARSRRQFGQRLGDFQLVQDKIARMAMELQASRMLVYRAAWHHDRGLDDLRTQAAMAKAMATESAQRIIDQAVQIHGGAGCMADSMVDQLYRSIRALRIYEGTTEIQHLVIARALIGPDPTVPR